MFAIQCGVSGLWITYDRSRPKGQRVVKVLTRCSKCPIPGRVPLDMKKVYKVIVNDYLAGGGDDFYMLSKGKQSQTSLGMFLKHLADVSTEGN